MAFSSLSYCLSPSPCLAASQPVQRLGLRREARPACSLFALAAPSSSRIPSVRSQPGKRERADFFATPATRNGAARAHPRNLKQAALPVRAARCRSHLLRQQVHRRNQASGHTILLQSHAAVASALPSFLSCCRLSSLSRRLRSPSLDGKHFGADTMYPPTTRFIRYLLTIRAFLLPYGDRYDWIHHAWHQ